MASNSEWTPSSWKSKSAAQVCVNEGYIVTNAIQSIVLNLTEHRALIIPMKNTLNGLYNIMHIFNYSLIFHSSVLNRVSTLPPLVSPGEVIP